MKTKKQENSIYYTKLDDAVFKSMVDRRRSEAEEHWNKTKKLSTVREENIKQYLATYIDEKLYDERYEEVFLDNRQFTSVRTIVPFLTARITAPEVTPANGNDLSIQFANDFEDVLQKHAERQMARAKIRLAVQDVLTGQRVGVLKWRYDKARNTVVLEHVKPSTVIIGKRGKLHEEPDYLCHTIERSVADLVSMFPDKEEKIYQLFSIQRGTPSQMEKLYEIKEEWIWVTQDGTRDLVVGWSYQNFCFGKIADPNWDENGKNLCDEQMIPFVFINFLNNGDGYIDETSYVEQAKYLQKNYNRRGQTVEENAKYGGTGVPIFAKGTITQKDVSKLRFSPIQRVLLDTQDVGRAFTVWQSTPLPNYIVEDKYDLRNSIDNVWGTPNILRGEQSDKNTLGQDVLVRNQAEGRLGDPIDCIDDSMERFYKIEAQMMYRYFDEEKFYNYKGDDGRFVHLAISQKEIADNIGLSISVKSGTSLPIDRAQRRQTIIELLKMNRVGTLTAYKELGVFDDPEAAYKEFMLEQIQPEASLQEVDKQVFNREANQDLQMIIGGKTPQEREDIEDEYVAYLTEWLTTDKYKMLQTKSPDKAAAVSKFIDSVIAKAQRKADKLAMQQAPAMPSAAEAMQNMGGQAPAPNAPPMPAQVGAADLPQLQ